MCHGFMTHPFFFFMDFFHRISRMNRKAFLLIGLLTEFRRILAAGQWLAPDMCCYCFLVTQISQMTQIFLRGIILSHRFHRFTQIFLRGIIFVPQISQIYTDLFESLVNRFVRSQGVSVTTGQVASAKIRE